MPGPGGVRESSVLTGATGYLGRWLLGDLLSDGQELILLQRDPAVARSFLEAWLEDKFGGEWLDESWKERIRYLPLDLEDSDALTGLDISIPGGSKTLYHLAADLGYFGSSHQQAVNVRATTLLSGWARKVGIEKIVLASSLEATGLAASGTPRGEEELGTHSVYGASKLAAEKALLDVAQGEGSCRTPKVRIARLGILFGEGDRWTGPLAAKIKEGGKDLEWLCCLASQKLCFLHIEEAVEGLRRLAEYEGPEDVFHVFCDAQDFGEVLESMSEVLGNRLPRILRRSARLKAIQGHVDRCAEVSDADIFAYLAWPCVESASRDLHQDRLGRELAWTPRRCYSKKEIRNLLD